MTLGLKREKCLQDMQVKALDESAFFSSAFAVPDGFLNLLP